MKNNLSKFTGAPSGIYLLPGHVPFDGKITRIRAIGFPDEDCDSNNDYYVEPLILRHIINDEYRLINQCRLHCSTLNMTFNCDTNARPPEDKSMSCYWHVETNDKIGVLYSGCPLNINFLNPNKKCHSARLYCDVDLDKEDFIIPMGAFEKVHILLNLEVNIKPSQWL